MSLAAIGLGSNLGDRRANLRQAVAALKSVPRTSVVAVSRFRETTAVGPRQPDFLNGAALVETRLSPEALLGALLGIEAALGRVRTRRHGPRTIDLDLLVHGRSTRRSPFLTLPHPRLHERFFVLAPLASIAPRLPVPGTRRTVGKLLARIRPVDDKSPSW